MIIFIIISPHFVNFFCTLFFTVLIVGHVVWIIERWNNPTQFHPDYSSGVMDGLWWAIVTQTTVGYGDKAPRSNVGKVFGIFWILYGLIVFGVFSSAVTGFLDEARAANSISGNHSITARTYMQTRQFSAVELPRCALSILHVCPLSLEFLYADRLISWSIEMSTSSRPEFRVKIYRVQPSSSNNGY